MSLFADFASLVYIMFFCCIFIIIALCALSIIYFVFAVCCVLH